MDGQILQTLQLIFTIMTLGMVVIGGALISMAFSGIRFVARWHEYQQHPLNQLDRRLDQIERRQDWLITKAQEKWGDPYSAPPPPAHPVAEKLTSERPERR